MESSRRDKLEKRPRSLPAEGRVSTGRVPSQTMTLKGGGEAGSVNMGLDLRYLGACRILVRACYSGFLFYPLGKKKKKKKGTQQLVVGTLL